jgi:hypothetical protein
MGNVIKAIENDKAEKEKKAVTIMTKLYVGQVKTKFDKPEK